MQSNIYEFRKPLPGQRKQDSEQAESLYTNQILDTLETPKSISGFWLDACLWLFSSSLIGQTLPVLSKIFGTVQIFRYCTLGLLVLLGFSAYLTWRDEQFFKPLAYRGILIILGILLGVL